MFIPKWLKDALTFNNKDRLGALAFLLVVCASVLLPGLLSPEKKPLALSKDSVLVLAIDTLRHQTEKRKYFNNKRDEYAYSIEPSQHKSFTAGALFRFDPNTASFADWQQLGLNERTSKTILKYVSKGGKFYKPEDLQRIWSLPEGFYDRVKDYITITSTPSRQFRPFESKPYAREERKPNVVDVNAGDTSAFIALPGIGSKLSARIIAFREKLGGFYAVEQVGETFGLPDSTFQLIKTRLQISGEVRKLNVNAATKEELKAHPYIRWNLANAIVEYRNQHGLFKNLEDLKNIVLVDDATFARISHYLNL